MFFSLQPKEAILSDINKELINLYVIMRDNPKELKGQLVYHQEMDASTEGCCRGMPAHLISSYRKKSWIMLLRKQLGQYIGTKRSLEVKKRF